MGEDAALRRTLVAGSEQDFMLVRGLRLSGTQREIGAAIAAEVHRSFPPMPASPTDPLLRQARRRWFEIHWPEHAERVLGFADALGVDPADESLELLDLVGIPLGVGCSAVWSPPSSSADGRPRLARNFDFRTGSVMEVMLGAPAQPGDGSRPMMSRPYVITSAPCDGGHASVVITACDFTGSFEGINDEGLVVVLLADDESLGTRPSWNVQAGVHELQVPRFLLDRCATVAEAVVALHLAKQYDQSTTCHYLVADRHGDAFVWERDTHNAEHVVRAADGPLCVTNYLLHRHPDPEALPADAPERGDMYARARSLRTFVSSRERLRPADLDVALDAVGARMPPAIARTLWHSTYDLDAREITIDFYLGDDRGGVPRRSDAATFSAAAGAA